MHGNRNELKLVRTRPGSYPKRLYFAFHDGAATEGAFIQCIRWGKAELANDVSCISIAEFKSKDKWARIFGELTTTGFRFSRAGFVIPTREIRKCIAS